MELLCSKCAREAKQVFWLHPNHTSSRAINIGDEEVRNRNGKGQDDKQHTHSMCTVTDQEVTTDGDYFQQDPGFGRDSVPPGGLSISLRVQNIIHSRDCKSCQR